MDLTTCPHCNVRVSVKEDGTCPSCGRSTREDSVTTPDNPYASPEPSNSTAMTITGLTIGEKFYSGVVIVCAGFLLMSIAMVHFVVIPGSEDPYIFYFVVSIMWINFFGLTASVATNLCKRSLLIIPTVVQCGVLCFMVYLIPIAIWGGVLLYFRLKRGKVRS